MESIDTYCRSLDKTDFEYLQRIRKAAQLMGQIINDLLLLSRVTRQELNITPINLTNIFQTTFSRLNEKNSKNIKFTVEDNLVTNADENLVPIVVNNLLGNELKYTSEKRRF